VPPFVFFFKTPGLHFAKYRVNSATHPISGGEGTNLSHKRLRMREIPVKSLGRRSGLLPACNLSLSRTPAGL
jgi:hypothetical protein